ncbi:lantibiotic dehydratase C-terminal domain-containing protein [Flavobacterium circumlabens]|uniref:lantibiotic dehydratase C-terminal domain-containing protein n=1 Tax=Flavobacterium circumlabens TaxID=2133765 RepID=UPI0035279F24
MKKILNNVPSDDRNYTLELIASFVHMNINRTFRSKQREYELICYDFMNKYYKYIIYKK